ncbi:MAG: hypothetical protein WCV00_23095 [Verrucomicrobiia bacterium]|jgi:hypothetical protein
MAGDWLVPVRSCGEEGWLLDVMVTFQKQTSTGYYCRLFAAEREIIRTAVGGFKNEPVEFVPALDGFLLSAGIRWRDSLQTDTQPKN